MQFFKSSFWSGLSVGIKAVSSLIINKVIATYYDPSGIALLAHFQNFLGIFLSVPNDGLNMGVIKYMANKDLSLSQYRRIFTSGLILNLLYFFISLGGILLFKDYFISVFAVGFKPGPWLIFIVIAIFLQLMNLFFLAVILSGQHLKIYVALNIASSVAAAGSVWFFAKQGNLGLTLITAAIGPTIFFFASVYFAIINMDLKVVLKDVFHDLSSYRQLGQFIFMAASAMLFGKLVDFIIRQYVIDEYGLNQTGLWQSVVKISDLYSAAFVSIVGMVYFPRISELIHQEENLKRYVRSTLAISTPVILIGLFFVYFFKDEFLVHFFEEEFRTASYLVDYQLIGDFFKLVSFILAYLIFAEARIFIYIMSQVLSGLVYIGLIYLCSNYWGLEGLPIAHAFRYFLYLLFVVLLYRKTFFA